MSEQFKGIQVTGTGKISLVPNVAYIKAGVVTEAGKVVKAVKDNTEKMKNVLAALKKVGVAEKSITTTVLRINPLWSNGVTKEKKRAITGYTAQNGVTVKLKDMALVGEAIDALSATANTLDLNFAAEYPDKEAEALALALNDANKRATKIAEAAGVELGRLYSCVESSQYNNRNQAYGFSADAASGGMPVAQGEMDLTATVQAVYAIQKA